ncbi:type II secretion system protein GspM [Breoghania sp.]|uniref:type II secretion system protein GspM n=1 Tax=Breoghania sp. TaxID=2065378 RepID=UPI002AA6EA03|nr:type II secretion system protein GspM [Breoghania sp.]
MTDMTATLRHGVSRIAALGLLALILWFAVTAVLIPAYERYAALGGAIDEVRHQLGRVEAILASADAAAPEVASDTSGQGWSGQSRSIVAAEVQEFLQARAREHNVSVISISPLNPRRIQPYDALGLRVECEGEIGAIRDLIGAIENAEPYLFILGTDLRRQQIFGQPRPDQKLPLAARLDIYAPYALQEGS